MLRFTSKFPFIRQYKPITVKDDYHEPICVNPKPVFSDEEKILLMLCKDKLTENNIPLTKIYFVGEKSFTYDVDNHVINPTFTTIIPKDKKHPTIEIGKPENVMTIFLGEYRTSDTYSEIKELLRTSKKGVVLMLSGEYDNVIWAVNLDVAIEYYKLTSCN